MDINFSEMDINFSEIDIFYGYQSLKEAIASLSNLQNEMSGINCGDLPSGQLLTNAIGQLTTGISSIDAIYTKVNNIKVYLEESSAEIAFLFDYLNGEFLDENGYIDEDLLAAAIEEKGLTDFYDLLDNANTYNETIANSEFMMAFDNGDFSNEDGTLNKEKLNQYLNEHPNVTCGDQVLTTYEANEDFLRGWSEGRFFDREGNLDMAEVERYLGLHPNVTCGDQVVTTYQANIDFLTAFGNGDFLENGTLNEDKLNQYLAQHPEVTCGDTVKKQFEDALDEKQHEPIVTHIPYPNNSDNLYYVDWNDPYVQTIVVSAWWGILEVVENIGDGLLWLSAAAAAGQASQNIAASWSLDYQMTNQHVPQAIKDTGATLIEYDWTAAGYDWNIEALAIAEEIAYGQIHDIASTIGTLGGYVAMTFVPGGSLVQAGLGGLSAAGSSTETALKSGASSDDAFLVGGGAFTLGAGAGYGVDAIGEAAKGATTLGQVAGWTGLGAVTAMTEPILNSVLEFNTYGKNMVDPEGNLLYNNWWDYYKESGAALNTLIAGGVGTLGVLKDGITGQIYHNKVRESIGNDILYLLNEDTFNNPKYYDPSKGLYGGQIWPIGEGSAQYSNFYSDDAFLAYCKNNGIEGLESLGAQRVTLEDLAANGGLTRGTWNPTIRNDKYGEYFGGPTTTGLNDLGHRVLGPTTTYAIANGDGSIYHINVNTTQTGSTILNNISGIDGPVNIVGNKMILADGTVKNCEIVCLHTTTADWFGQTGGADQYTFYLTDGQGNIYFKNTAQGPQTYKLTRNDLIDLGILSDDFWVD